MNAMMVVPFENGSPQFPGLPENAQVGFCTISYSPPPAGTAPYVLVELTTTQTNIDILTARPDCLFLANVIIDDDGKYWDTAPLLPTERNAIRAKVADMGFTGSQYGLLNAAIQSSQNREELVFALGTKAFFRDKDADFMAESDMIGAGLG